MEKCPDARTQAEQQAIKPEEAVQMLKDGNQRFKDDKMMNYCYGDMAEQTAKNGQYPFAAVLCCIDSRIPLEKVFDQAIGDLFVARVAGNFINTDIVGSLEFAVLSGVKSILILGHTACGAVKGACGDATGVPALDSLLSNIKPAVKSVADSTGKTPDAKDPDFVQAVADLNVKMAIDNLKSQSSVIDSAIKDGKLKLVGGMYDLASRVVTIHD